MIRNIKEVILSETGRLLKSVSFDYFNKNKEWETKSREVYVPGDAATVALFNIQNRNIILTRQFRIAAYCNHSADGWLLETCAGKLDHDSPETCIKREIMEETGYRVPEVTKIFETYMSPGNSTELVHYFIARYHAALKEDKGGGLEEEGEEIEVLELSFDEAYALIARNKIKDAKTILLLQYLKLHIFL